MLCRCNARLKSRAYIFHYSQIAEATSTAIEFDYNDQVCLFRSHLSILQISNTTFQQRFLISGPASNSCDDA